MNIKKIILVCVMLVMTAACVQAKELAPNGTITVQGKYQLEVAADQAKITLSTITDAPIASDAQSENAKLAERLQQKLLSLNIDKDHYKTVNYAVYPVYSNDDNKGKTHLDISSYRVVNTISVTLDDINSIGKVVDAAVSSGANQISQIRFSKKDQDQLQLFALQGAVKNATDKAEAIAGALGKHLGRVCTVSENGVSVQMPNDYAPTFLSLKAGMLNTTPINAGTIKIEGMVTIVYELQ
jgi:uncharacterized protein YggE